LDHSVLKSILVLTSSQMLSGLELCTSIRSYLHFS